MAPRELSEEHKAALEQGRRAGRAVKDYLTALEGQRPKRGRKRTRESVEKRLAEVGDEIVVAAPLQRLQLVQERLDLEAELERMDADANVNIDDLEAAFVEHCAAYSASKGICRAAWREVGVPAAVLTRAGLKKG